MYGDIMENLLLTKTKLKLKKEININILTKIKFPKITICVLSTIIDNDMNKLLSNIFENEKLRIITNKDDPTPHNIVNFLVSSCTTSGDLNTDVLLLTISPKYTNLLFKYIKPNYILIKNYLENIYFLPNNAHFILNADDPKYTKYISNTYSLYGIEIKQNIFKNEFSKEQIKCPNCNQNLTFNYYYDNNLGDYYCPNCNLKRLVPTIQVTHIDIPKNIIVINDIYKISLKEFNISNIYNILSIVTLCSLININLDNVINFMSTLKIPSNNISKYNVNKKIVYVINTNNINDTLLFIKKNKELKTILINLKEIKNLYEINFELLKNDEIDKIICTGEKNYDVGTRIKYSSINEEKIVVIQNIEEAVKYIKTRTEGNIYAVLDENDKELFDHYMKGEENGNKCTTSVL